MLNALLFALGLLLLTVGGESLIRGSLAAAKRVGVSPLLSGLVIVGFGTSAPELVVSVDAALTGRPDIAIGNVIGSNIGNVLLVLGLCALIMPLAITPMALQRDAVAVTASSAILMILAGTVKLSLAEGVILLAGLAVYIVFAYLSERALEAPTSELSKAKSEQLTLLPKSTTAIVVAVIVGFLLLIGGSHVFLTGAIGIASNLGISQAVAGLILVAIGTSLPELAICLIATLRRHADVAIGNVLGSNIFNLLGILGVAAVLQPLPFPARILEFDQWIMLGSVLLLTVFLYTGSRLSRIEGAIFVIGYGVYVFVSFKMFSS